MKKTVASRKRYRIGKYEIVAQPIPHAAHMLRYTVYVDGRRIGAMASVPSESDCLFMEKPPVIPPLVPYQVVYRPGRPKKGTAPRSTNETSQPQHEDLPHGLCYPQATEER